MAAIDYCHLPKAPSLLLPPLPPLLSLQALVLFMLMVRLIQYVSFQPHLAVIGGAIVRALPLLTYWAVTAVAVVLMFVMLLVTCYGYRVADMADVKAGVYDTLQYIIVINRKWGNRTTVTEVTLLAPLPGRALRWDLGTRGYNVLHEYEYRYLSRTLPKLHPTQFSLDSLP